MSGDQAPDGYHYVLDQLQNQNHARNNKVVLEG